MYKMSSSKPFVFYAATVKKDDLYNPLCSDKARILTDRCFTNMVQSMRKFVSSEVTDDMISDSLSEAIMNTYRIKIEEDEGVTVSKVPTAYNLFFKEFCKKSFEEKKEVDMKDLSRLAGLKWADMNDEARKPFIETNQKLRESLKRNRNGQFKS